MALEFLEPNNFKDFLVQSWEFAPWVWDFLILSYLLANIFDIATKKNDFLKSNKRFVRSLGVILALLTALVFNQKDISIASSPQWIIFLVCLIFSLFMYQLFKSWFPEKKALCIGLTSLLFLFMFSWITMSGRPTYYESDSALASIISFIAELTFFFLIFGGLSGFISGVKGPSTEGVKKAWSKARERFNEWNEKRKENKEVKTKLAKASEDLEKTKRDLEATNALVANINIADATVNSLEKWDKSINDSINLLNKDFSTFFNDVKEVADKLNNSSSRTVKDFPFDNISKNINNVKNKLENSRKRIFTEAEIESYESYQIMPLFDLQKDISDKLELAKASVYSLINQFNELVRDNSFLNTKDADIFKDMKNKINTLLSSAIEVKEKLIKKEGNIDDLKKQLDDLDKENKSLLDYIDAVTKPLWNKLKNSQERLNSVLKQLDEFDHSLETIKSDFEKVSVTVIQLLDEITKRENAHKKEVEETARLQNLSAALKVQEKLIGGVLRSTVNVISTTFGEKRFNSYVAGKSVSKGKSISPSEAGKKLVDYLEKKVYPPLIKALEQIPAEQDLGANLVKSIYAAMPGVDGIEDAEAKKHVTATLAVLLSEEDKIKSDVSSVQNSLKLLATAVKEIIDIESKGAVRSSVKDLIGQSFFQDLLAKEQDLDNLNNYLEEMRKSLDKDIKRIEKK